MTGISELIPFDIEKFKDQDRYEPFYRNGTKPVKGPQIFEYKEFMTTVDSTEEIVFHAMNGISFRSTDYDLFMKPKEKIWFINIYRIDEHLMKTEIFKTEEAAKHKSIRDDIEFIKTIEVNI